MATRQGSKKWYQRHIKDEYVQKSRKEGYRSRAAYKLLEIDDKQNFITKSRIVLELGASPGSWSEVVLKKNPEINKFIAVDILDFMPLERVDFVQGDILDNSTWDKIDQLLKGNHCDLILSDLSPNHTGVKKLHQLQVVGMLESIFSHCIDRMKPNACMLTKVFEGAGVQELCFNLKKQFACVKRFKPKASRQESAEFYLYCQDLLL